MPCGTTIASFKGWRSTRPTTGSGGSTRRANALADGDHFCHDVIFLDKMPVRVAEQNNPLLGIDVLE